MCVSLVCLTYMFVAYFSSLFSKRRVKKYSVELLFIIYQILCTKCISKHVNALYCAIYFVLAFGENLSE